MLLAVSPTARTTSLVALFGAVWLTTAACGNQSGRAEAVPVTSIDSTFEVEVREAGADPRQPLRFRAGAVDKTVDLSLAWRASPSSESRQPHVLRLSWKGGAGFRRELAVRGVRPDLPAGASAAEREAIAELGSRLRRIQGYAIGDVTGLRSVVQQKGPPMQPELPWLIYVLATPLPDAPVGLGATWHGVTSFPLGATLVTMTFDYRLEDWQGDVAIVNVAGQIVSASVESPADRLVIEVAGRVTTDLADYLPRAANVQLRYPGHPKSADGGTSLNVTLEPVGSNQALGP